MTQPDQPKPKRPIIGFAGIILTIIGAIIACNKPAWGIAIVTIGAIILVYALFTGNIKLLG